MKLPIYVVDIKDDSLLGNDFLSTINFGSFYLIFWNFVLRRGRKFFLFSNYEGD